MKKLGLKKITPLCLPLARGEFKRGVVSLISVIFILLVGMAMTGCMSAESYRVRWDPVPANGRIEASVHIAASECKLTDDYHQLWKLALNPDSNIVNYRQAQCDSIVEDMTGSHIFRKVVSPGDANYDLLIKLASLSSKVSEKISLSVVDPKSQDVIASYDGSATYSTTGSSWANATKRVLADIRNQMLGDYLEGKGVKSFLIAKGKIQEPLARSQLTQPQQQIVIKSDIDELPAIKAKPNKNSYAIVIGIENYRQKLPKADYAVADAKTVTEYLTKVMGYPEENVITLLNEHASNVDLVKYFEKWLSNNVDKNSTVFIYYSGHGAPNPKTGDAYLVPYDGDPTFIAETGYPLKRLYESLGKLQAREIIVALDSCFSGAGGRSVLAKGARPLVMTMETLQVPQKIAVLSAASGDQISSTYDEKGHGLFTYFMLKGIKGEGDINDDGKIEIGELFDYIKPQVERIARKTYNNEQSPQLIAPMEKQKIFLRN